MTRPIGATYRLQFRGEVDFDRAAALAPYWARLGVTHLYASPVFAAAPGSTHGYDVVDHNALEPSLGGREGFERMSEALKAEGLGLILDIVPNHMAAHELNPWWADVLEWGEQARHAQYFDIDWRAERLLLPTLGQPYQEALEAGELKVARQDDRLVMTIYDRRLPLTPPSYGLVLGRDERLSDLARSFAAATPAAGDDIRAAFSAAPEAAVAAAVEATNADRQALHRVHEAQVWRLGHWRLAREALTYRRFFEITDLVGVKVERPEVFEDVHRLIFELVETGRVDGLRVDHVDGLSDPEGYLRRLDERLEGRAPVWVEKILHEGEALPESWACRGTTGYEFVAAMAKLMVDPAAAPAFTEAYAEAVGRDMDYERLVDHAKRFILTNNLAAELDALTNEALSVARRQVATRDLGRDTIRRSIIETARAVPVYRSYVSVRGVSEGDRALIEKAAEQAKATRQVDNEIGVDFVKRMLLLDFETPEDQAAALGFATRFQQVTGPVTAKALEDTVFYRYNRLVGLNEVGGAPELFGASLEAAHDALAETPPGRLNATATHDTKRGEDARARLYALTLAPERWIAATRNWAEMLAPLWDGPRDRDAEWMFLQNLYAAWPRGLTRKDEGGLRSLSERLESYLEKAAREAKARTSWTQVDEDYEARLVGFARAALHPQRSARFLDSFPETVAPFHGAGAVIGLGQLAAKLFAPGIPDIYQGTERFDLSLVDPDNRRPVDFPGLRQALEAGAQPPADVAIDDPARKLRLMAAGLRLRRSAPALFERGRYERLAASDDAETFAFARTLDDAAAAVAIPVRSAAAAVVELAGGPAPERFGLVLPEPLRGRAWRDAVTGAPVEIDREGAVRAPLTGEPLLLIA